MKILSLTNHTTPELLLSMSNESDNSDFDLGHYDDLFYYLQICVMSTTYALTFMLGFFGNILVIFSIFYLKNLQSITNMFLVSLATADLLLIIVCVPARLTEYLTNYWVFGHAMCKIFNYAQFFSAICSVLNLTVMSLERYLAILHPLKAKYVCTKRRARLIIAYIWTVSFLAAMPILWGKDIKMIGLKNRVPICVRTWAAVPWKLFETYRLIIILVVPVSIMSVSYALICRELWRMPLTRQKLSGNMTVRGGANNSESNLSDTHVIAETNLDTLKSEKTSMSIANSKHTGRVRSDDDSTRKQIIKMLICIVVLFFLSWSPIIINHLLVAFNVLPNVNFDVLLHLRIAFNVMSYFNSCINPIVYGLMSKNFRQGFRQIIGRLCCFSSLNSHNDSNRNVNRYGGNARQTGRLKSLEASSLATRNTSLTSNSLFSTNKVITV